MTTAIGCHCTAYASCFVRGRGCKSGLWVILVTDNQGVDRARQQIACVSLSMTAGVHAAAGSLLRDGSWRESNTWMTPVVMHTLTISTAVRGPQKRPSCKPGDLRYHHSVRRAAAVSRSQQVQHSTSCKTLPKYDTV
jgi:hypothetical protein